MASREFQEFERGRQAGAEHDEPGDVKSAYHAGLRAGREEAAREDRLRTIEVKQARNLELIAGIRSDLIELKDEVHKIKTCLDDIDEWRKTREATERKIDENAVKIEERAREATRNRLTKWQIVLGVAAIVATYISTTLILLGAIHGGH